MPDKEKNKAHPFAGILHSDEEILWILASNRTTSRERLQSFYLLAGCIVMLLALIVFYDGKLTSNDIDRVGKILGFLAAICALYVPIVFGVRILFKYQRPLERAYAVTNERLLYRHQKAFSSIDLEDIPFMTLSPGIGKLTTLHFGPSFPAWPDVENALEVKRLIEDARKQREQAISSLS